MEEDFLESLAKMAESLIGPFNWEVEQNDASKTFKGNFLVYDRAGKIKLRVKGQIVEWRRLPAEVYV